MGPDYRQPSFIRGVHGLGDTVYMRAAIRRAKSRIWVETPWPQLFADMPNIRCVRPTRERMRTQLKNMRAQASWHELPRGVRTVTPTFVGRLASESMPAIMEDRLGMGKMQFDLPDFGPSPIKTDRPVAIVRPATVRREWPNPARNPAPEYVAQAAAELRRRGYFVVSVADLEDGEEWMVGEEPSADLTLHAGELDIEELLAATQHAAMVVGGVGWILPVCVAAKTPVYVILGGCLGHNAPERLTDPRLMILSRTGFAWPDAPCFCTDKQHDCKKVISGFNNDFSAWFDRQGL